MLQGGGGRVGPDDPDRVEAHRAAAGHTRVRIEPGMGEAPQSASLAMVYRLKGMSVRDGTARLHLHDRDVGAPRRDDVDLPLRTAPVAIEDRVPEAVR